jgi:two-component system, OmpR family, KDP operon response regulator KdpE
LDEAAEARRRTREPVGGDQRPVLVVADLDPGLRLLLKQVLSAAGYEVQLVSSIQALIASVQASNLAGFLISSTLAGDQTSALLRSIKSRSTAFIMALCSECQQAPAFEDLDDRIVAPFREDELVLRVANAHRRARSRQNKALAFIHHGLVVDLTLNEVTLNARRVSLSRLEFEVLRVLAENEGRIVGYDRILRETWRDPQVQSLSKLRHVIHLLRLKLGHDEMGRSYIVTNSRAGYGLRSLAEPSKTARSI